MPQYLRPTADISTSGGTWAPTPSTPTTLFDKIDEETEDLADYITTAVAPVGQKYRFQLGAGVDPGSYEEHDPAVTCKKNVASSARVDLTVRIFQGSGATAIATHVFTNIGSGWTTFEFGMTATEIDLITNYGDLEMEIEFNQI